jgi:hypothetical protein
MDRLTFGDDPMGRTVLGTNPLFEHAPDLILRRLVKSLGLFEQIPNRDLGMLISSIRVGVLDLELSVLELLVPKLLPPTRGFLRLVEIAMVRYSRFTREVPPCKLLEGDLGLSSHVVPKEYDRLTTSFVVEMLGDPRKDTKNERAEDQKKAELLATGRDRSKPVPPSITIRVTHHARKRAKERYGKEVAKKLPILTHKARRQGLKTRDGLRPWILETPEGDIIMLALEKCAATLGGLFEAEIVTLLTPRMYEHTTGLVFAPIGPND